MYSGIIIYRCLRHSTGSATIEMAPLLELEHVIDASKGFKRPVQEGREAIQNVIMMGVKDWSRGVVHIEANCSQEHENTKEPDRDSQYGDKA